jgi:hypothetical protein
MALSRRAFLAGFGGGLASAAVAWTAWQYLPGASKAADPYPIGSYVDYAGWIVTKADKDKLTAIGSIKRLENTDLLGRDLKDDVVPDVDSCAVWCLGEPDCRGFNFGKPTHPDPHLRSRCWLRATTDLRPVPNPNYSAGIR